MAENRRGDLPNQADCEAVGERNGLASARVLIPKTTTALDAAGLDRRHTHFVLIEGAQVFHTRSFSDGTFEEALDQALAR